MNNSTISRTLTRGIRLSAVAALLTGLLAVTQPARAFTHLVTNSDDSGLGSLRQAITAANNNPGADIITFAATTNGNPIILEKPAGEDANASGDLDILNSGNLTIQGNGAVKTIIDGGEIDRVFHVCPGGGCINTVTFTGLTIRNGSVTDFGGGIYNEAGTTTVVGSTVSANTANYGGGIYNASGTLTVTSSTVSANTANSDGGGIFNGGTLNVQNGSTIGGKGAGNTADNFGGGIINWGGTTTVDGSTFSANTAAIYGGGIYNYGTLTVQNGSTIGGAGAPNMAIYGGGIYNYDGTTAVDSSTVRDNTVTFYGGGIYNYDGTTTVDGSTVRDNSADRGGGIYNEATLNVQNGSTIGGTGAPNTATWGGGIYNASGTTTVDGSTISANMTTEKGGGIYNEATLNVQNGSTIGGAGAPNTADYGGGIYNEAGTTTVDSSTVSANTANSGGGIVNEATLNVQNGSTIGGAGAPNTADTNGGGIYNQHGTLNVKNGSTVSANSASNSGGGIYNYYGMLNVLNGSTIGGVGAGNTANNDGGGIYNEAGTTTVDSSTVSANTAGDDGGGIYNRGTLNVQNGNTIGGAAAGAGNTATSDGGGIFNAVGTTTVTGSRILNNTASNGGGVFNDRNSAEATSVTGSCIVGNSAMSYFNNRSAQQIATGNWWGAATGPNTPGADTYGGNVDYDGYLTAPILGCAPDLQVGKTNDTGGNGTVGTPFHWILTVNNTGLTSATFDALQTILEDDLPAGPTYGAPVAGSFVDVANSANIQCILAGSTLACAAAGGDVTLGAITGSFKVTFSVTPGAPVTLVNPAGICRVDPDGNVTENDESNNDCPVNVVNVAVSTNYLYLPLVLK